MGKDIAVREEQSVQNPEKLESKMLEVSGTLDISSMVKSVGGLKLTDEQKGELFKAVPAEDIEIRPDGLIYVPGGWYRAKLREMFGLEWALVPKGDAKYIDEANLMVWGFFLVIKGSLMGYALGENPYYKNNKTMSYGDAIEGCKTNALTRLCKDLGMTPNLWIPSFAREWVSRYALEYKEYDGYKKKEVSKWRRKTPYELEQPLSVKTEEYLAVENEIKLIVEDPQFTGMVESGTKEIDLDYQKHQTLSRIGSGRIYKLSTLESLRDRLAFQLGLATDQSADETKVEREDIESELGDGELPLSIGSEGNMQE